MTHVLVVDDAADLRLLVRTVLRRAGIEVTEATNGEEALELLDRGPLPDAVVLDIQMPKLDGWDTLAAIRADPRTVTLPVIVCTVRAQAADVARAWTLGADAVVTKPFAVEDLSAAVLGLMEATRR